MSLGGVRLRLSCTYGRFLFFLCVTGLAELTKDWDSACYGETPSCGGTSILLRLTFGRLWIQATLGPILKFLLTYLGSALGPLWTFGWIDFGPTLGRLWVGFGPSSELWGVFAPTLGQLEIDFKPTFESL